MSVLPTLTALVGATAAGIIDARTGYIPNPLTGATALVAFGFAAANGVASSSLLGAFEVGGLLFGLYVLTRGCGLGLGDVKLGVAIGAGCGPSSGIIALGAAFIIGGMYGSLLLATRRARGGDPIRFGPFLAFGTLAACVTHPFAP